MGTSISDSAESVTEPQLSALELRLGITLPPAYRAFLLRNNGGKPSPNYFGESSVRYFYGVGDERSLRDLESAIQAYAGRVPAQTLPIAEDSFGNLVTLSLTDGRVFFWDHEREGDDEGIVPLADSLDGFLAMLREYEE